MPSQTVAQHEFVQQIIGCFCEGQQVVPFSLITKRDRTCLAFSSTLGCAWILKGFCERFLIAFPLFPVVEEVKPLRRLHVQSLLELQRRRDTSGSARSPTGPNSSGEEWLQFVGVRFIWSTQRWDSFADFLGGKKRESESVQMCEICIVEIYVLFLSFLCAVVCLMSRVAASAMTECAYLTCRNKMSKESCCCSTVHPCLFQCCSDWAASASHTTAQRWSHVKTLEE